MDGYLPISLINKTIKQHIMAKFNIGDTVIEVNSKKKGVVTEVYPLRRGIQIYSVFINNKADQYIESDLKEDANLSDPFERLKNSIFGNYRDFARINTSFKIQNTSINTVSSLKASRTTFRPFQYKPLLKFLNSDKRRLLIADEVGLGKTIEAGHIMLELRGRRELNSAIVVCPKSLQQKWQDELSLRFNIKFKIYEHKDDLIEDVKHNPTTVKAIVNYEKFRSKKKNEETNDIKIGRKIKEELSEFLKANAIRFDLVVCDEAHKLRNRNTLTRFGIEPFIKNADSVIFLTATPIMLKKEDLYNQLNLLDEENYSDYEIFENEIESNRPFITALSKVNTNFSLPQIATELSESRFSLNFKYGDLISKKEYAVGKYFENNPMFNDILDNLNTLEDCPSTRAKLQFQLSLMNPLNSIFTRTRKREVTTDWTSPLREARRFSVELSTEESEAFNQIMNELNKDLGAVTKKRMFSSSVWANLLDIDDYKDYTQLITHYDSKFSVLTKILQDVIEKNDKKIIIFSTFKNTLNYLFYRLKSIGVQSLIITGDVVNRYEIIQEFKDNQNKKVLLSSEVGSEGLDMQFCDVIVNYDLPWNPMVVEQRIGRIDRIGQKSERVHIFTLVVKNSIEEEIYDRLLSRINIFKECLGELEAILEEKFNEQFWDKLYKVLYSPFLTREEKSEKLIAIERAIELERINLNEIQEGLSNTVTNDIYFKNELDRIVRNKKYVTDGELLNYVNSIIANKLTTCRLEQVTEMVYRILIPPSSPKALINFLIQYSPNDPEVEGLVKEFVNTIRDVLIIPITFNQQYAYENSKIAYINSYHPITLAILNYFAFNGDKDSTFRFSLSRQCLEQSNQLDYGDYILGVYSLKINRTIGKEFKTLERLVPVIFDIKKDSIIDNEEVAESVLGNSQQNAEFLNDISKLNKDKMEDVRADMICYISGIERNTLEDEKRRTDSETKSKIMQLQLFYDNKIRGLLANIERIKNVEESESNKTKRSILPILYSKLNTLTEEKDQRIDLLGKVDISSQKNLLSLNHIVIN